MEDTIAVCGLGTIGLLLLMFLREAGFQNIFMIGNKDFQKETILRMGFQKEYFCDGRKEEAVQWLMERTGGVGADVFFECAGSNESISQAIDLTAMAGKICLTGNPFTDIKLSRDIYWKILRNQLTVTGTWNSVFTGNTEDDWHYVLGRLISNRVMPEELISHKLSIREFGEGFRIMRDKTENYIKIMGVWSGSFAV